MYQAKIIHNGEELLKKQFLSSISRLGWPKPNLELLEKNCFLRRFHRKVAHNMPASSSLLYYLPQPSLYPIYIYPTPSLVCTLSTYPNKSVPYLTYPQPSLVNPQKIFNPIFPRPTLQPCQVMVNTRTKYHYEHSES